MNASLLPSTTGVNLPDGSRASDGKAGFLCHGPYIALSPGPYTTGLYLRRVGNIGSDPLRLDATCDGGTLELGKKSVDISEVMTRIPGLIWMDFEVTHDITDVEIRLWVPDRIEVQLREMVLFRRDALDWCV